MVDASEEQDKRYCHVYQEGDGKKGGNNIASSLLMKTLEADILNILDDHTKGKELNVVFDNCPGQNKNHHVLWLVPYLVEKDTSIQSTSSFSLRGIPKTQRTVNSTTSKRCTVQVTSSIPLINSWMFVAEAHMLQYVESWMAISKTMNHFSNYYSMRGITPYSSGTYSLAVSPGWP